MAKTPSLTALLGLLAMAGYQNRDKIAEMLNGLGGARAPDGAGGAQNNQPGGSLGGSMGGLGGLLTGAAGAGGVGGLLGGGLKDLMDRFNQSGEQETAGSWVSAGPNKQCSAETLRRSLGSDTIADISAHTGLSEDEVVARLCRDLPDAVDKYTPDGRLPSA